MSTTSTPTSTTTTTSSTSSTPGPTDPDLDPDEQVSTAECAQRADSTTIPPQPQPYAHSDSSSPTTQSSNNPQSSSSENQPSTSSSLVEAVPSEAPEHQSSNDVVPVSSEHVAHSDFSLVSHTDFNIAPGQFRMALEEATPPIIAHNVEGDNGHALINGVVVPQQTMASDSVVPNGVHVHAGDQSPIIAQSNTVPYLDSTKTEELNNSKAPNGQNLPHVASILQAGPQMGDPNSLSQQQEEQMDLKRFVTDPISAPSEQDEPVDSSSSTQPPAPVFIMPALPPSGPPRHHHHPPRDLTIHSKTDVRAVVTHRFKAQEAKEREERVRKRLAAGLPAEDPATPTGTHAFLLSPSASMTSGGRPSSAMSSSMMSEGSGVFSSDMSQLSRSSSMFSLDSSTGGSIGPLEPGALKVTILHIIWLLCQKAFRAYVVLTSGTTRYDRHNLFLRPLVNNYKYSGFALADEY